MFNVDHIFNVARPGRDTQGPVWSILQLLWSLAAAVLSTAKYLWFLLRHLITYHAPSRSLPRRPQQYYLMRRIRAQLLVPTIARTPSPSRFPLVRVGQGAPGAPKRSKAPLVEQVPCSAVTHCAFESRLGFLNRATAFFSVPTFDVQALSASRYDATTLVNQPDAHDNQPLSELDYPIVIDTGASVSVTPNPDDFTEGIRTSTMTELTKGLNDVTTVQGYGPVNWTIYDSNDVVRTIRTTAFYVPEASIRLFSPQSYFQEVNGGSLLVDKDKRSCRRAMAILFSLTIVA